MGSASEEEFLNSVYRFTSDPSDVNWNARRKINPKIESTFHRSLKRFCKENIPKITFGKMSALVPVSGGIDSTLSSYLVGEAMNEYSDEMGKRSVLGILNCVDLEDKNVARIAKDVQERFKNIDVKYVQIDIRPANSGLHDVVKNASSALGILPIDVPGEITTRTICNAVNGISERTGMCTIDSTNGTEYILGELCVGAGYNLSLLSDLYKSSVFEISSQMGVPEDIINTRPLNSSFGKDKLALYFGDLPEHVTPRHAYEVLDTILYWLYDVHKSPLEIAGRLGHSEDFIQRVAKRVVNQEYRRKPAFASLETRQIVYENKSGLSDIEVRTSLRESMLGEVFRRW